MEWIPWFNLGLNVTAVGMLLYFGLPKEVPLFGREDSDPIWGYVGLMLFGVSVFIRINTILNAGG